MSDDRDDAGEVEWLDVGAAPPQWRATANGSGSRRRRWLVIAAVAVVAGAVVAVIVHGSRDPRPPSAVSSRASTPVERPTSPTSSGSSSAPPAVTVTNLGHALLGADTGWELIGRGIGVLVRIDLGRGRITRTNVPAINSSGPVTMVIGTNRVLVEPLDEVPGFVVVDGQRAGDLPKSMSDVGYVFPGPHPDQVWAAKIDSDATASSLRLLDGSGRVLGPSVSLPEGGQLGQLSSDGAGGLLYSSVGGTYELRPDGLRRVTSGQLIGIGASRFVSLECDTRFRCTTVVTDRSDGAQRVLVDRALPYYRDGPGVVSPDGRTAALLGLDAGNAATLHLVDLTSFHDRTVNLFLDDQASATGGTLAWSPDSRWLFTVRPDGTIAAVDAHTAAVHTLDVALPSVSQLGIRAS